jgi:exopolysaccharide production protein ExoZ
MSIDTSGKERATANFAVHKIENLQALRGVAILLVLFYHIAKYEERLFGGDAWLHAATYVGRAGVDLFFVISGFVMATITRGCFQKPDGVRTFLLRRAGRIYPIYWFYTLVYLPFFLFRPDLMNRVEGGGNISLWRSALLFPHTHAPLVGQGWTLVHEIFFYIMFGLLLFRPEREKTRILVGWAALLLGGYFLCVWSGASFQSPTLLLVTSLMTLEFIAGCLIAELVQSGRQSFSIAAIFLGLGGFMLTLALPSEWNRVWLYLLPAGLLVYGAVAVEAQRQFCFPLSLRFIGDISYSLYLSHMIPILLVNKAFRALNLAHSQGNHLMFICVAAMGAIAFGAASYYWVEKPILRWSYAVAPKLFNLSHRGRPKS